MISWQAYYKLWSFKSFFPLVITGGIKLHRFTVPEGIDLNSPAEEIILADFWCTILHCTVAGLYMIVCQEMGRCTESGAQVLWVLCACVRTWALHASLFRLYRRYFIQWTAAHALSSFLSLCPDQKSSRQHSNPSQWVMMDCEAQDKTNTYTYITHHSLYIYIYHIINDLH